jgi:hypothetical protein
MALLPKSKLWRVIIALVGFVFLILFLVALFYAEEDWRGKRAWESCKQQLEAKGEALDWNAYVPAPVPDDQNFFKTLKMQEWFVRPDWHHPSLTNELTERLKNDKTSWFGEESKIKTEADAEDYLTWSDQFKPDFNLMRDALKRPYARMDGDYSASFEMPTFNFVVVRVISQTLAQRANCYLLLGQPKKALDELAFLHDLCRLLESKPTGKPITLVSAMVNIAVSGLYAETVANGLQMKAWREPQLIALQEQLRQMDMSPVLVESIREERAGECHFIETSFIAKIQQVKNPNMMRGWFYQNMVTIARLDQEAIDSVDLTNNFILPQKVDKTQSEIDALGKHFRPYTFFAEIVVPNLAKAFETLGRNQTMVNEGQIVCALERYHLAHSEYPETLDALAPQFIEKIPHDIIGGQPLHYRRMDDGKFLLYSVGWNEKDDGGSSGTLADVKNGDWVWK